MNPSQKGEFEGIVAANKLVGKEAETSSEVGNRVGKLVIKK